MTTTDHGDDRRAHSRAQLPLIVQFRLDNMGVFLQEHAINLSAGGMFIRTDRPHHLGDHVYLQFRLRDGQKLIEGVATVVHINPPGHEAPGMGLEFLNLDEESQIRIDEIVLERLGDLASGAEE